MGLKIVSIDVHRSFEIRKCAIVLDFKLILDFLLFFIKKGNLPIISNFRNSNMLNKNFSCSYAKNRQNVDKPALKQQKPVCRKTCRFFPKSLTSGVYCLGNPIRTLQQSKSRAQAYK
jgi:hypothetical protein